MSLEETNQIVEQYCEYINKLPGVMNSKALMNEGGIKEIHVLTDTSRSPKQIVRDIQSLLMAQFQLQFDHRVISVAQIECEKLSSEQRGQRFSIEGITLSKRRENTDVEVSLSYGEQEYSGMQTGLRVCHEIHRGIAAATLQAVSHAEAYERSFSVLDLKFTEMAGERICAVCISVTEPGFTSSRFVGTAFSKEDDSLAIVKATLDALNRKIFYH